MASPPPTRRSNTPPEDVEWEDGTVGVDTPPEDVDWEDDPPREDWMDATRSGASVVQPPTPAESVSPVAYGPVENPAPPVGTIEAFIRSFGQGALKQGSDEVAGALISKAAAGDTAQGDVYRRYRDVTRADLANAEAQHPVASFVGNTLGDIGSDYLLSLAGVPVQSQPYQIASGAFTGLMGSEGDLTQPTASGLAQAGADGALGGAAAYALPLAGRYLGAKAAPYLSRAAGAVGDWWGDTGAQRWLENTARERALKAVGYIQKDFARGAPRRQRLIDNAQLLLDEPGLITPFASKAAIADRVEPLVEREGRNVGRYLDMADANALERDWVGIPTNPLRYEAEARRLQDAGQWRGGSFNPYEFMDTAREDVVKPFMNSPTMRPAGEGIEAWLQRLDDTASNRLPRDAEPFTFRRANEYKGEVQNAVFNDRGDVRDTINAAAQNDLQRVLTRSIDDQASRYLEPEQLMLFQDARRRYGAFVDALPKSIQGANRDLGNNALGLKDMDAAQTAAQMGAGWLAPAVALGSKLVRGRADSFAARTADSLAHPIWLQDIASAEPELLGRWGQYLGAAAARSPEVLGLTHSSLAETDPEYQQRMRLLGGQDK